MNSYTFKKIISILLSIMICVLNTVTPLYADEETPEFSSESKTEVLDNSLVEETIEEQVIENEEVNDEIEQNNTALITDNENVVSTASEQEYLPETVAEGDTFADIQTLKTFYESNNEGVLQNALDFTNFSNNTIGANAIGLILLSCVEQESFEGYTIILNGLSGGGSNLATAITGFPYTFHGLGRSDYPFKGTITVSDATQVEYFDLIIDRPFFNSIDVTYAKVDKKIKTIKISTAADSAIAFAQEVVGNDESRSWGNVKIEISKYSYTDNESTIKTYPGSCIGVIKSGAYFSLGNVTYTSEVKINEPSGNAGLLCNAIEENASFSVGSISISGKVSISSGFSSGGLVGKMATNSSLNVGNTNKLIIDENWEIKGKDAGALIGSGNNVSLALNIEVSGAKITSDVTEGSAGGIFGYYNLTSNDERFFHNYSSEEGKIKVTNVTLDAIAERISCGALFGKLELSNDFQIDESTSETEIIVTSTAGLSMSGGNYVLKGSTYYGGLVGQVFSPNSNKLLPSLRIDGDISVNSTVSGDVSYYGGLIGILGKLGIDDPYTNGVYIVLNSQVSTNCINSEKLTSRGHYFGGAIGGMFYDSVLEIAEGSTFIPTATNIKYGGGIVGVAGRKSTLRLAGTTNLSNVTFSAASLGQNPASESNYRNTNGQIVGAQNASIIYAAKTWELTRPTNRGEIDDIGNYGSVIRLGKNIGQGSENLGKDGGLSESLISQNSDSHKTEFEDIAALPNDYGTVEISNADQFALLSIADQTYGDFDIYKQVKNGFIISDNKIKKIIFADDINLSNTGIIGFQRDFYNGDKAFIGTLDGGGHKITLDIGQLFANNDSIEAGSGQIHGHPQVGLFSQANATIINLTISGTINIRERTLTNSSATSMAVGAAVALSTGSGSIFDNVTTEVTINCYGTGTESAIGGLLGLKQGTDSSVSISNSTGKAAIIDNTATGAHVIGGLIGTNTGGGTITVDNSWIKGSIEKRGAVGNTITNAKYGGLISVIKDNATIMKLNKLIVDGQKIINDATSSSGGLLGYEWDNTEVYFGDGNSKEVTITGESEVTIRGDASIGGLVYCATGYWQVNNLKLNKATIQNQNGDLGLLICYGRKDAQENTSQITQLLYVEETKYDGYHIDGANITLSSAGGFYDEWVVYTAKDASTIIDNGNSVISIATQEENGNRKGFDTIEDTSTGYQNKTTNKGIEWVANPNARYYYDLDFIRERARTTNGFVDTAGEVVLWSVWRYCEKVPNGQGTIVNSNIQNYLRTDDIVLPTFDGDGAEIDLTGYSYYPVTIDGASVDIKNCTIKFANQIINAAEEKSGKGLDSLIRNTTGTAQTHTQHYMMHTGLILNYLNTSKSVSSVALSVNNVQLKGTIGKSSDNYGSGAIVCGVVEGTNLGGNHFASVKLHTVTMDNLVVNTNIQDEEYAPLLINKVDSYGGIDSKQISTFNYNSNKVATSLIGHVGSADATNISIAFSNAIELNGKTNESIFTHATLLESFQYLASSSGYYHFNESEKCTYGKEIDGTVEYVGQQLYYFDTRNEIKDGNNNIFNTKVYLPYVYETKVKNPGIASTFHELEINIVKPDLNEGCGTYDDPYIIKQAEQLNLVAQYIEGNTTANWKINIVDNPENIKTENKNNHTLYVFDDQKWKKTSAQDDAKKSESEVRDYLRNAYYKIFDDLELNNFSGLGTMESPFRGVVDGGDKQITVNAEKITSGFINVSYGSVVQNLNIVYTGTKTLLNTQAALNSNTVANKSYFGGIIGDVKGGDNLINKVSVSFKNDFKIKVHNHLQCVGGFFGIVEGGGVILSGMDKSEGLKASHIDTTLDNNNQAYISPLVGRVLDGFVINEIEETAEAAFEAVNDNGGFISDKNYSIGNILSTASLTIVVRDDVVNVTLNNAEELLLLSALINSGACNGGWSLAYKENYGKVRNADYSKIGNIDADNKDQYFNPSRNDDAKIPSAVNLPYLINKYAGKKSYAEKKSIFWNLCMVDSQYYLQLNIKNDLDMSHYKNGYRGIGGRYNCTATSEVEKTDSTIASQKTGQFQRNTPVFVGVDGGKNVLTVSNIIKGYSDDNYVVNAAGGLINVLRRKVNTEITIENLTVSGNVELHDFSDTSSADATNASGRAYAASVGGVIGRYFTEETGSSKTTYLKLNNLAANRLTLYSDGATGGIVGQTGTKSMYVFGSFSYQYASGVTYTDCSYSNLKAMSCQSTGGILGAACDNADSYYYNGVNNDKNVTSKIVASRENVKTGYNSTLSVYASTVSGNGLGGLIGNVGSNVEINKDGTYPLVLDKITLQDSNATGVSRTGGVVGFLHHGITKAYNITVSNSALGNGKDDNLGGIVGCWFSSETGGVIDNIVIDKCTLTSYYSVGGLVGYIQGGIKDIRNITVNNTDISQITYNSSGRGVAMVVGEIVGGGIIGENILLKGNTISAQPNVLKGRIVGKTSDLPIQLLGVSISFGNDRNGNTIDVSSQPAEDIGSIKYTNYSNNASKIFISYDAFLTEATLGSGLAQYPYVSIPGVGIEETLGANTTYKITGDTVKPYTITGSDTVTGIVDKESDNYTYIGVNKTYQYVATGAVNYLVPGIVSTYNANQDTSIPSDFDVIQIDGSAACLRQYLNAATNGAFATVVAVDSKEANSSKKIMTVDVSRYKWNSESNIFEKDSEAKPTLVYDSKDGSFYATAQYDNQNNMFTLVSVTFKTTANNYSRTYHIPVIVRRMLQVDFMATMVSGTVFNAAEMDEYKTHALASKGEEITGYLTFKYNSNLSGLPATYDWQGYMNGGANLLGYYQKTLDTGSELLPEGTQITLIDCQQSEKRYYAVVPEGGSCLELFSGSNLSFSHSDGTPYQPVSLAELLKISSDKIKNPDYSGVKWVSVDKSEATVVDTEGQYYRLYDDNKDGSLNVTDCFELSVTNNSPEENYFVVISVPNAENHMLTLIKTGGVTKGDMTWSNGKTNAPPTEIHQLHRYTDVADKYTSVDTNKSSEITFNFLDNYSQKLDDQLIIESIPVTSQGASFVEMEFEVKNELTFNRANYEQSDPLYQELRVSLRKTMDNKGTDMYFPSDSKATVNLYAYYIKNDQKIYFEVDENGKLIEASNLDYDNPPAAVSYDWIAGNDGIMVLPFAVKNTDDTYQYVDLSPLREASRNEQIFYIEAKFQKPITIGINSVIANDILPVRESTESLNQTSFYITSLLSFKESGLSYSTLKKSVAGNKGYYLNEKREAVLKLDYLNIDQLGVNLSDEYSGEIDTMLTLDLSGSEGFNTDLNKFLALKDSDSIEFEFSLKQKGKKSELDSEAYNDVPIGDYIPQVYLTNGQSIDSFILTVDKKPDGTYPYYNENSGVFNIPVTFEVNTTDVQLYSNYRIYATAKLKKGEQDQAFAINEEKAFITYTIAKININGIWSRPIENG